MIQSKGSQFERAVCKQLSKWWSGGQRDDIFWRSSQSGGRATQRSKRGVSTFGSYGDIAAVDPLGQPLMQLFTIELKRGRSHGYPGDLLDTKVNHKHPWVKSLHQAVRSHKQAGSKAWMMICKRDRRLAIAYLEAAVFRALSGIAPDSNYLRLHLHICDTRKELREVRLVGVPLDTFLAHISPADVRTALRAL